MLQSPMFQELLSDPAKLKEKINSNPMARMMMAANPHVASMLENPDMLKQVPYLKQH